MKIQYSEIYKTDGHLTAIEQSYTWGKIRYYNNVFKDQLLCYWPLLETENECNKYNMNKTSNTVLISFITYQIFFLHLNSMQFGMAPLQHSLLYICEDECKLGRGKGIY